MAEILEIPVFIAGGGPVGTTLALDLAYRDVASVLVEQRFEDPPNPKCNTTNARSMEHFRRLGCADAIRRVGLPLDRHTDVVYATRWIGKELTRYPLRSSQQVIDGVADPDTIDAYWPTPEPQHRVSQLAMEPVLREHTKTFPACDYREGWRFLDYTQHEDYVDCEVEEIASGEKQTIRCKYLISCEGARSSIRKKMGSQLTGREVVTKLCTTYFRSPEIQPAWPHKPGWMHRIYNPDGESHIVAINGTDLWLHHSFLGPDADLEAHDHQPAIRNAFGFDFDYEMLGQERWTARAMVADRYREKRVFLCGDAAHIWIPMGGFGMNAGVEDAVNLSWKLWARLSGWADDKILDSYEAERRAIGQLVAGSAAKILETMYKIPVDDPLFEADGSEADAVRAEIGRMITERNMSEFDSIGMQLGVSYDTSPIIMHDNNDPEPPPFAIDRYEESSRPGVRAPHVWRASGAALYDDFGKAFTLLRIGAAPQTDEIAAAFEQAKIPLTVLDVPEPEAIEKYQTYPLVLVRPDQHIAWRGHACPEDLTDLLNTLSARN